VVFLYDIVVVVLVMSNVLEREDVSDNVTVVFIEDDVAV
jgi:hypothetical protein